MGCLAHSLVCRALRPSHPALPQAQGLFLCVPSTLLGAGTGQGLMTTSIDRKETELLTFLGAGPSQVTMREPWAVDR